ncbi:hypothetical protein [Mesotoga prima]|uniref:hypothetical protein n=1 Tax=Mesotoga prima TaxID=1184387 RepID=UPI002D80CC89|nr:hypothetical protein [Mesotoga prima]
MQKSSESPVWEMKRFSISSTSGLHPRIKMESLCDEEKGTMFSSIRSILKEMAPHGGRDSERDFFGNPKGHRTSMEKVTCWNPCPRCGKLIQRQGYLGGKIYFFKVARRCAGLCTKEMV